MNNQQYYCVILAGGKGKRLWPCSRQNTPKQFIDFFGTGRTQLQQTFDRFAKFIPKENFFVCTNHEYEPTVAEQLPDVNKDNILAEPVNRNTAPSVAWACYRIKKQCPKACVIVAPSDQAVLDIDTFVSDITGAMDFVADHDVLVALGIIPSRPEPGYGYIQVGEAAPHQGMYHVKSFTEKPERDFARVFMESGEFYWNTGIFLANVQTFIDCFSRNFPIVFRYIDKDDIHLTVAEEHDYVHEHFPVYPNTSMDECVLEKSDNVYVLHCNFGWADMGTWHSIYEAMSKGEGDNVVLNSHVIMDDCHGNIIKLPEGRLGVFNGLEGFIVAEEGNILFICKKGDSSAMIRKYVNEVQIQLGEEYV